MKLKDEWQHLNIDDVHKDSFDRESKYHLVAYDGGKYDNLECAAKNLKVEYLVRQELSYNEVESLMKGAEMATRCFGIEDGNIEFYYRKVVAE